MDHNVDTTNEEFPGLEFKIQLLRRGLTSIAVARRLGVSHSFISHICAGRMKPSFRWSREHREEPSITERLFKIYRDMEQGRFTRLEDY